MSVVSSRTLNAMRRRSVDSRTLDAARTMNIECCKEEEC